MHHTTTKASAPGKLILLGEYAVLEGAPCLVSTVEKRCIIRIEPQLSNNFRIESSRTNIPTAEFSIDESGEFKFITQLSDDGFKSLRFVLCTIKHFTASLSRELSGANIYINTDSFFYQPSAKKLGLGASAAITVSLLNALMKCSGRKLTREELYREAYQIHRKAQGGLGSGMDIAASATGGIIEYQLNRNGRIGGTITPVQWPEGLRTLSIWAGQSASTQNMVRRVQAFRDAYPARYDALMEPMKQLSKEGCHAFRRGDTKAFMEITTTFYRQEKELGDASGANIISKEHQMMGDIVESKGGSYKPSGAGGGDIGIAFCDDEDTYHKIKAAIKESRFELLDLPLQVDDTAIETN